MKVRVITALFDINRDKLGDGRTIEEYLIWFSRTLKLKCDMTIYTEEKFVQFIILNRVEKFDTKIIVQKIEDLSLYKWRDEISKIITTEEYLYKMKDTSRIECYLPEYNIIQYSKFSWLNDDISRNNDYDYFFWMDAGCSRFFDGFDLTNEWPNKAKLKNGYLTIQGNANFVNMFNRLDIEEYIWDNNCVLVGTLFGGDKETIAFLNTEINRIFKTMVDLRCINNEQFALAIFSKQYSEKVNVVVCLDGTHLPLFKLLS